jgi:hypothetical protein
MTHRNFINDSLTEVFGRITTTGTTLQNLHILNAGAIDYSIAPFATPAAVQISSSSAVDTVLGTGAQTVLVVGLDANYNKQVETIPTNGLSASIGTKVFSRVFSIDVLTAGTGAVNAGNVFCSPTGTALTSGVPTAASTWVMVAIGDGFGCNGLFTVPANKQGTISAVWLFNTTQIAEVSVVAKVGGAFSQLFFGRLAATSPQIDFPIFGKLPEKTDIYLRIKAVTTGAIAAGRMSVRIQ